MIEIEKLNTASAIQDFIEEIELFIDYGVSQVEKQSALDNLKKYASNTMALVVLRDFYSRLPEFREEAVSSINRIVSRRGMYLLGVDTAKNQYLYFFDGEHPFYLGEKKDGIGDSEVLSFFGYANNEDFLKRVDSDNDEEQDITLEPKTFCPACGVAPGELHELGCPVEICPWCDGQLNYCNCRFEKLGVDEIVDDSEIDRLEILLNNKGRIPFSSEHAPSYPSGGSEPDD